jgi:hypothetical protein
MYIKKSGTGPGHPGKSSLSMVPGPKQLVPQASDMAQPDQYLAIGIGNSLIPVNCCLFAGGEEMVANRK